MPPSTRPDAWPRSQSDSRTDSGRIAQRLLAPALEAFLRAGDLAGDHQCMVPVTGDAAANWLT